MAGSLEDALLAATGEADVDLTVPALVTDVLDPSTKTMFRPIQVTLAIGPGRRPKSPPLVSCLMVTKDRFELARLSIGCFRRQTWPRKELIVLDESADSRLRDWIAALADPDIRVVEVSSRESLGQLRNRSLELATGDFICQWDDDDLQHPARLEIAFAAMAATGTTTSLLSHEMMWMPQQRRLCVIGRNPRPQENTLLTPRGAAPRYPDLAKGEDTPAVYALLGRERAVMLAAPQLYLYIAHGRNTWYGPQMEELWRQSLDRSEGAAADARLAAFAGAFPVREYAATVAATEAPPAPLATAGSQTAASKATYRGVLLDYMGREDADFSLQGYLVKALPPNQYQLGSATLNLRLGPSFRQGTPPLVSCLMVTRDRFELARFSVDCFRRQSWPNRELVVLDGSIDDRLRDWIDGLADPSIRWISTRGSTEALGALRNRSIAEARGDVLCIWDDDDLHHPVRVEVALAAMTAAHVPVSCLAHEMLWMIADHRVGVLARRPWPQEGTLIAMKSAGLRYPSMARAEDTPAILDLLLRHQGVLINAPELYVYAIHGGNTWDRAHHHKLWASAADRSEGASVAARLMALGRTYPIEEYAAAVRERNARLRDPVADVVM